MKSAIRPTTRSRRANARRPAVPPRDFKDLSSFEKIVLGCMVPAKLIFDHLDETEPYSRSWTEENNRLGLIYLALAEMALGLCVGTVVWCVLKGIALVLRKVQRPKYYPQERLRRQTLARERRRIRRRTTLNAAPTADELLAQWAKVKRNPEEMIRFGSMLCDLEAYVDNSLLRNENGEIVGRNPGIRGWLNANCQPLAVHYKTVMGYKAMAEKFRQAVGLADPYPAAFALDDGTGGATPTVEDTSCQNTVRKADGDHARGTGDGGDGIRQNTVRKAVRRKTKEMLAECRRSQRSVWIALARRLSPDLVPPEVEREERRRQGLPARDGLARRFVQMMA
ncbi:MAG: hypothetical protein IJQ73_16380 [Kiritimatiellae bacterium]|nr:hypothetical protein [Kiritimatiellia bacterium]